MPNFVTRTSSFEWYVAPGMDTRRYFFFLKEIELRAQNIGVGLHDHLVSIRRFPLIMNYLFI